MVVLCVQMYVGVYVTDTFPSQYGKATKYDVTDMSVLLFHLIISPTMVRAHGTKREIKQ